MAIKLVKGKVKNIFLPVLVSTAFTKDTIVEQTSGYINPADDNDTVLAGVIRKAIASTDVDYATARRVPVTVPMEKSVIWEIDAINTFTVGTDEGLEFGISDAGTLDHSDTTNKVFFVTKVVSATKVQGYLKFAGAY